MTFSFDNIYLGNYSVVVGPEEKEGKLNNFDKTYKDFYLGEKSFEKASIKMSKESFEILLDKVINKKIELVIASDLSNQIGISSYFLKEYDIPFLGYYAACASFSLGVIIASLILRSTTKNNIVVSLSSHNKVQEREFRNPVEYGMPNPLRKTYTITSSTNNLVTKDKTNVKITGGTIGKIVDLGCTDLSDMGSCMAPSCADTIYNHLKNNNETINDYDLILTGDLGKYGKEILKNYLYKVYNINAFDKIIDASSNIYKDSQKFSCAGGSGPCCISTYINSKLYKEIESKKYKKVLVVSTGCLVSTSLINQKLSMPAISHAVTLEAKNAF